MMAYAGIIIALAFLVCLGWAAISDLRTMRIPNWISLALVALFALWSIFGFIDAPGAHVLVALGVLLVTFGLFAANWLGAGDAKLLAALALWMGPQHIALFVGLVAILGGIFAAMLLSAHWLAQRYALLNDYTAFARSSEWMRAGKFPYGVPICVTAAAMTPSLF